MINPMTNPPKKPSNVSAFNLYAIKNKMVIDIRINNFSIIIESSKLDEYGGKDSRKPIMKRILTIGMDMLSDPL